MAWSWSHTAEAYADAYANTQALARETLVEILAEWHARDESTPDGFNEVAFEQERARLMDGLPTADVLADAVWELAEEQQICDSGGYNAWLCPYGCGCHTVPFDRTATGTGG